MGSLARRRLVIVTASSATFMASLDLFIVNIAYPALQRSFHADSSHISLSWVLNGYAIVFAALPIPLGSLADLYGHRRAFVAGTAVFASGSALCALAPSIGTLVVARVIQAVGAAALVPTSLSILLDELPQDLRTRGIASWAAGGALASAAGVPVGALLAQVSWRMIFLVNLPIAAATAIGSLLVLRGTPGSEPTRRPDFLGATLLIAGVAAVTLFIIEGPERSWWSRPSSLSLLIGVVSLLAFAWCCVHRPDPLVDPALFANRSFTVATVSGAVFFTGFGAFVLGNVLLLTQTWGHSILRAGLEFAPGPLVVTLVSVTGASRLITRFGVRAVTVTGSLLFAGGAGWMAVAIQPESDYLDAFLIPLLITGVGIGLVAPALPTAITAALEPDRRATGSAIFAMSRQLGTVFGVAILVALTSGGDSLRAHRSAYSFVAVASLTAGLTGLAVRRERHEVRERGLAGPMSGPPT